MDEVKADPALTRAVLRYAFNVEWERLQRINRRRR